jgi:hypothetical protein
MNGVAPIAVSRAIAKTNPSTRTSVCERYLVGLGAGGPFRGSAFHVGHAAFPNILVQSDLDALKALSMARNVRSGQLQAFRALGINGALAALPGLSLEAMPSRLQHEKGTCSCALTKPVDCGWGACDQVWSLVRSMNQFHRLVAPSKLLARKRLSLFPIYDARIASALGIGTGWRAEYSIWATFQAVVQDEGVRSNLDSILESLTTAYRSVPTVSELTLLRLLDICLWMP